MATEQEAKREEKKIKAIERIADAMETQSISLEKSVQNNKDYYDTMAEIRREELNFAIRKYRLSLLLELQKISHTDADGETLSAFAALFNAELVDLDAL